MRTAVAVLIIALFLPSCQSKGNYLMNRGGDLVDIVRFQGLAGKAIGAKLEITRLAHLGIGYFDAQAAGLANRELGTWHYKAWTWGVLVGYSDEQQVLIHRTDELGRYAGSYGWNFDEQGPGIFTQADADNPLDLLTARGTLALGIGLDVSLRVGEVIDFLVGIFQFDPAGDDVDYTAYES